MLALDNFDKKVPDERVYIFLRLDNSNSQIAYGVSQFPTDQTYYNDGRISVPEVKIMSLIEHDKNRNLDRHIVSISDDERRTLIEHSFSKAQFDTIKGDIKRLKALREKYFKSHSESARLNYEEKLNFFGTNQFYTTEMLENVADRLTSQAQDPNNSKVKDLIFKEIKFIKKLKREKEYTAQTSINITLSVNTPDDNGSASVNPIMSIEIPHVLTKIKVKAEQTIHLISVSILNVLSDIKKHFKTDVSIFKKNNQCGTEKNKTTKPKCKPKQPLPVKKNDEKNCQDKKPLFSIDKIKSDKYAPISKKDKSIEKSHKNDLDI